MKNRKIKKTIDDLVQGTSYTHDHLIIDHNSYNFDTFHSKPVGEHSLERDNRLFFERAQSVLNQNGKFIGGYASRTPVSLWQFKLYDCNGIKVLLTYAGERTSSGGNRLDLFSPSNTPSEKLDKLVDKITRALATLRLEFKFFPRERNYDCCYRQLRYNALAEEGLVFYDHEGKLAKQK